MKKNFVSKRLGIIRDDATDIHETAVYAQRRVLDKGDKTPDATGNGSSNGSSDRQFSVTTN